MAHLGAVVMKNVMKAKFRRTYHAAPSKRPVRCPRQSPNSDQGWVLFSVANGCTVVAEAAAVFQRLAVLLRPSGFPLGGDQKLTEVPT
jgi:hypothetical protein